MTGLRVESAEFELRPEDAAFWSPSAEDTASTSCAPSHINVLQPLGVDVSGESWLQAPAAGE